MNSTPVSESSCGLGPRAWLPPTLWGIAAGLSAAVATVLFVRFKLPLSVRVVVALVPLLPSLGYVGCVVRMFRQMDELHRRIQLEALSFAFPATAIVVMAVDLLEQAGILPNPHLGWAGLVVVMCLLWMVGWIRACRRYQ